MKLLKKYKYEIITCIQFFLLCEMLISGFWYTYLWIWFRIGLPIEWYSLVLTAVLGLLSVFGLSQWICKTERELENA